MKVLCKEYIFVPGECACYMGVFSYVCWLISPPPTLPLKPSVGDLKAQGPPHLAMGLCHPLCPNIYCPGSPGWRILRKAVVYLLTLG